MKMENLRATVRVAAIGFAAVLLAGCGNLFTGNMFENFDGPPSASDLASRYTDANGDVSTADAESFVNDLDDAASSSRFFDGLSDSDRESLAGSLESVYSNTDVDTETRQRAAVLAGDVTLRGSSAGDTINNVADVLTSSSGTDSFSDPAALLDQIIPTSAKGDPAAIEQILNDMVTAADAYSALGSSLTDADGDGTPDGPSGANMTEVAQKAAVSIVVAKIVTDSATSSTSSLAESLASGTFDASGYSDPSTDATSDGSALNNILKAGGLDGLFA
tara:strand:- start:185 stop:1012 length:828 start_codon:yes stop_codon:yes gene_type:complete